MLRQCGLLWKKESPYDPGDTASWDHHNASEPSGWHGLARGHTLKNHRTEDHS